MICKKKSSKVNSISLSGSISKHLSNSFFSPTKKPGRIFALLLLLHFSLRTKQKFLKNASKGSLNPQTANLGFQVLLLID